MEDNKEKSIYNDSLIDKNYEKIIDIIGKKLKNKKQVETNRNKIISLLKETFPDITDEKLEQGFKIVYGNGDLPFKTDTIEELNLSLNRFSTFILDINNDFKDHGYSLLVLSYFYLTSCFLDTYNLK